MKPTQPKTADQARQQAIDWQAWQADQSLTYSELLEWQEHLKQTARQFGLTAEFKENGII